MKKEVTSLIQLMEGKYTDLVWYDRKGPSDDEAYWAGVSEDIRTHALNQCSRVEELMPDEVDALKSPETGDWSHGFNSGVLAALRLLLTAEEEGADEALDCFPQLDT